MILQSEIGKGLGNDVKNMEQTTNLWQVFNLFGRGRIPRTIYGDVKVKRKKSKRSFFIIIAVVCFLVGAGFGFYQYYLRSQIQEIPATLAMCSTPISVLENDVKIESGGKLESGNTVQIPPGNDRVVFLIGRDISIRTLSGTKFVFTSLKRHKKTNFISVNVELKLGRIWVQKGSAPGKITITNPVGSAMITEATDAEFRVTHGGTFKMICWRGSIDALPAGASREHQFTLGTLRRSEINRAGAVAVPYEVDETGMSVWQAWNLSTSFENVVNDNTPSFKEAFLYHRNRLRITGGFQGELTPRTLLSGGTESEQWKEGGVSPDSGVVLSYSEASIKKTGQGSLNVKLTIRNDGVKNATGVKVTVKAIDQAGDVVGRATRTIEDLEPGKSQNLKFSIEEVPSAINYRTSFEFPEKDLTEWNLGGKSKDGKAVISYREIDRKISGNRLNLTLEIRNEGEKDAKKVAITSQLVDPDGFAIHEGKDTVEISSFPSKEKRKVQLRMAGYREDYKLRLEFDVE